MKALVLGLMLATLYAPGSFAETAESIVKTYMSRNALGIKVGVADLSMIIKDRKGRVKTRKLNLMLKLKPFPLPTISQLLRKLSGFQ